MNLDKFEKIDGGFVEAITLMRQGKKVAASNKREYVIRGDEKIYYLNRKLPIESVNSYNDFVNLTWYIPKPFDVRQAMLDRPNEWVGAFNLGGVWMKLGFDEEQMMAVEGPFDYEGKANMSESASVGPNWRIHLDKCIPLEDVPEEATR